MNDYIEKVEVLSQEIIGQVFNKEHDTLPNIKWWKERISIDDYSFGHNFTETIGARREYGQHCFPILCHEFFVSLKKLVTKLNITNIAELGAGAGWLSYWANKYGINSLATDNYSWQKTHFKQNVLGSVICYDSIDYIKDNPSIQLFILSWPYMDAGAYNIWQNLKEGQYLLYIGEGEGGCTADEQFFKSVADHGVDTNLAQNFLAFAGVHDTPTLYCK